MSWFEFLLIIHILAAVVWLGGAWMLLILGLSLRNADTERRTEFTRMSEKAPSIVFAIASILLIIAGTLMVSDQPAYEVSDTWVVLGYAGWFVSFLFGVGFYGQEGKRREKVIEERGMADPGVLTSLNRVLTVATVDSVIITLVVIDMVLKPGL